MATYETLQELPEDARERLRSSLMPNESFEVAFRDEKLLGNLKPFFIVTDRRLITYKKVWRSEEFSDTLLDRLSRVGYDKNPGAGTLELVGTEIEESYSLFNATGQPLADTLREQIVQKETP